MSKGRGVHVMSAIYPDIGKIGNFYEPLDSWKKHGQQNAFADL
jgi:hypothetical protein